MNLVRLPRDDVIYFVLIPWGVYLIHLVCAAHLFPEPWQGHLLGSRNNRAKRAKRAAACEVGVGWVAVRVPF